MNTGAPPQQTAQKRTLLGKLKGLGGERKKNRTNKFAFTATVSQSFCGRGEGIAVQVANHVGGQVQRVLRVVMLTVLLVESTLNGV